MHGERSVDEVSNMLVHCFGVIFDDLPTSQENIYTIKISNKNTSKSHEIPRKLTIKT